MSIPSYTNPCIVSFSTASAPSSTIYLIGVSDTSQGLLEVNKIDISNLSNPLATLSIANSNPFQWSNTAPKICSTYPGYQPADASPFNGVIHIQQFGVQWSSDANVFLSIGKIEQPSQFDDIAYPDPKLFATVGNAGLSQFALAMTNTTDNWGGIRYNATDGSNSLYGTRSGTIYNATGSDTVDVNSTGSPLTLSAPQAVSMRDVTFTVDAIPLSSGAGAYILDKAYDGTTAMYYINPSQSTTLQRVTVLGPAPTFIKTMVGTVTPSQIILYSIQLGGPQFHVFDLTSKTWTASSLITPGNPSTNPGNGTVTPGNNGIDASPGSKLSPGGIMSGILTAVAFIALAAFFVFRRHRRRPSSPSSSSSSTHSNGENGKSELAPLYTVAAAQDGSETVAIPVDASYPPPPSSSTVSYPLPPRNSIPRDPQLTPAADSFYPPPPSGVNALRNPQSPMWKSLAFDFIPKTPPGPELHYSDSWGDYADVNSKHHSKDVYSTYGGSRQSQDISSPTIADGHSLYIDDPYDKRPFTPRLSSEITPVMGTPQSHDRSQEHLQSSEQSCSSPLVLGETALPSSDLDAPAVPIPASDPIDAKPLTSQGP
ncbi:hypothetical protein BGW39_005911 [Mortierella sp. 14UC]|nr:hypothetical protein BGW39_005911 [Mortierella sp. 14UC]